MIKDNGKGWREELLVILWAHRIVKSQAIGASPFYLVYGLEAIIPIDLVRPAMKLAEIAGVPQEDLQDILEEKHNNTTIHNCLY